MIGWLFTWCAVALGVCSGWSDPALGVTIYFMFSILRPEQLWFWSFNPYVSNNFSLMVAISTLLGWMIGSFGDLSQLRRTWVPMLGMTVMVVWGLIATVGWARFPDDAWGALNLQFKMWLMVVVAITTIRTEKQVKIFAWMIVLSIGYLAYVFNCAWVFEHFNRARDHAIHGDNNNMALVMVVGIPAAFFMGLYTKNIFLKCLSFFFMACMNHLVLFSFSRGGMLGMIVVGIGIFLVTLIKLPRKMLTITIFGIAVAGTVYLAGAEVRQRFWSTFADETVRDDSAESRKLMVPVGLRAMREHPGGVGPRNMPRTMPDYDWPDGKLLHNNYLQIGCDWGVIGLAGWLAFHFGAFFLSLKVSMSKIAQRLKWPVYFGRMVCIGLLGFFFCATFLSCDRLEPPSILALLGLCTYAYCKRVEKEGVPEIIEVVSPAEDLSETLLAGEGTP